MNIKLLIKGIIIGIAKIIPGLSGAILMISFNLYDKAIHSITCFFENPKKNLLFILNLGIGIVIGIVSFSKVINYFITHYYLYTTSLFIGLILGGIPIIRKSLKINKTNLFIIIISFLLMVLLGLSNLNNTYTINNNSIDIIIFFLSGILEAIGTIIPGISSTALLMLVGVYNLYISTISNIFNLEYIVNTIKFIIPFSIGMFSSCILLSLLINYLFEHHKEKTFSSILGISLSTIFLLLLKIILYITNISNIVISIILLLIGYYLTSKI